MMLGKQRREEILRRIQRHGYVSASQLSDEYNVDPSTIRRDLEALSRMGLVMRSHGGASMRTESVDLAYDVKLERRVVQKRAIAQAAAAQIEEGTSAVIDSGSTTLEVARALRGRLGLTVVTDDLRVSAELAGHGDVRLIVTGGEVMPSFYTLIGERAAETIRQYQVDVAIIGVDADDGDVHLVLADSLGGPLANERVEGRHHFATRDDQSDVAVARELGAHS